MSKPSQKSAAAESKSSSPTVDSSITSASPTDPTRNRLISIDALRGFDMLLIIGLHEIATGLQRASKGPVSTFLVKQFEHKEWEGFGLYDLIFPLFVFLVGISLVFSLGKASEVGGTKSVVVRLFTRATMLFLLGVFYNGGIAKGLTQIRWMGVLQRIAISYFFASLVFLASGRSAQRVATVIVAILLIYWGLLRFIPVPGQESISFEQGKNLANYLDQKYLPGRLNNKTWDPEGLLSSLPAVATCLFGVLAGFLLKNSKIAPAKKLNFMLVGGAVLVVLGFLWGLDFPVIKKIWTSSYVLVAAGFSFLATGLFYLIFDIWKLRRGAGPLIWVGSNALTMYLVSGLVDFRAIANRIVGGEIKGWFGRWDQMLVAVCALAMLIALAGFMYRKKIFIRV